FPTNLQKLGSQAALLVFFVLVCLYRRALFNIIGFPRQSAVRAFMVTAAGGALLSVIVMLAYPSLAALVNGAIERAYHYEGPAFLSSLMINRHDAPVEAYFYRGSKLLSSLFSVLLFVSVVLFGLLLGFEKRRTMKRFLLETRTGMGLSFLVVWLLVPLGV